MKKSIFIFLFLSLIISFYSVEWKNLISKYGSSICLIEVIDSIGSKTSGSGFVISKDGMILTNAHVVKMAYFSKDYTVVTKFLNSSFSDKEFIASVVAIDIEKDVAILKIDKTFDNFCILGDSNKLENMDEILVVGYPLGMGFKSTPGNIQSFQNIKEYGKMLDLTAVVDPGNSGGPVFNKNFEVIGIVTAKIWGYNFNLAIPISSIKDFINLSIKSKNIKITSEPSGAKVYINKNLIGTTPINYEIFGVKNYLKISLNDYVDIEREIDSSVKDNETLNFVLTDRESITKRINITTIPEKASVYVNDELKGETPFILRLEAVDKVKIKIKKDGYKDYEDEIVFNSKKEYDINIKMKKDLFFETASEHGNLGFTFWALRNTL